MTLAPVFAKPGTGAEAAVASKVPLLEMWNQTTLETGWPDKLVPVKVRECQPGSRPDGMTTLPNVEPEGSVVPDASN